jgi:hypothetical protein
MNIKEEIDKLTKLQEVDAQILKLTEEKNQIPERIANLEESFRNKQKDLIQLEEKVRQLQMKRKEKELELSSREESIKKYQIQLYQVKSNKEYQSLQKEIEGLKADNSILEDEIIAFLEEIDGLKAEILKEKDVLSQEEEKMELQKTSFKERIAELEKQLNELNSVRKDMASRVDREVLSKYERILKNKDGLAVVPVRNNACQGCFMGLPPQVINEIKMQDRLIICEVCSRILYLEG